MKLWHGQKAWINKNLDLQFPDSFVSYLFDFISCTVDSIAAASG